MADEPGMEKGELRKLLSVAKKTPVNAAIGMLKDGTPVMLLHKIKQPRSLSKELEGSGDLKNMRWGEFLVDEEKDPRTLIARLNKPVSGLARRLVKQVKFAGFAKVELQFEDGTSEVGGDDEEEAPADPQAAPPPKPDLGPVTARVMEAAKQMVKLAAGDPAKLEALTPLAKAAQAAIQVGQLPDAEQAATAFEQAIAKAQAAPAAEDPMAAKASAAWVAVRGRVDGELTKLLDVVRKTYQDHAAIAEIEKSVKDELDKVLQKLDDELTRKLDAMRTAPAADRPKLVDEAKAVAARYQQLVASDRVLSALDDNPFVPLSVQKTVNAALSTIVKTIR